MADSVEWLSQSFSVHSPDANWSEAAGVYIFAALNPQNQWFPIDVGQATSFRTRLPTHERWSEAARLGATHIHAIVVPLQESRTRLEAELIRTYRPHLNEQLKP